MGIYIRTLMPFLLFYLLKESLAQIVHDVVSYTSKSMEDLDCYFTSTDVVLWTEQRDGLTINLFSYTVSQKLAKKQTDDIKYDNFNYSIEGTDRFNLVIKNVDQSDGGLYQCNPITSTPVKFDVTVEVLPTFININCRESNVCMPSAGKETAPEITCVCTATGVNSSQLGIQWDGVGITSTSSTAYGSASITSEVTLRPPTGTSSISCSLTGYRSQVPERLISYNYTFSQPVCNLTSECPSDGTSASLICSCFKGSPSKVNGYSFYDSQMLLIDTQLDSSLQVDSDKNETFYCKGCNGVLHDQLVSHALICNRAKSLPFLSWIFIIFGILLLLLVAAVILKKKSQFIQKVSLISGQFSSSRDVGTLQEQEHQENPNEMDPLKIDGNKQIRHKVTSPNQAPLVTERTQGDGKTDTDTQGRNGNISDSSSQTTHGEELSVDPTEESVAFSRRQPNSQEDGSSDLSLDLAKVIQNLMTPAQNMLSILSVGRSGVGKLTIGNMLLCGEAEGEFPTSISSKSCTRKPRHRVSSSGDCEYTDVPGIPDTNPANTAKFYDMIIKEAKKELTVILFVFKRERDDPGAYMLAEMLFRELNKSNAAKILVINDHNSYKFKKLPTKEEYEEQLKTIKSLTKIEFCHSLVVDADTMQERMKALKIMLSKMNREASGHLKTFSQLREYVKELRDKKNYQEEVVLQERDHMNSLKRQVVKYQGRVIAGTAASILATVSSFSTTGATLGLGGPTTVAEEVVGTIQIKKAELEKAEKRISTDNEIEKAAKELKEACEKFEELEGALKARF